MSDLSTNTPPADTGDSGDRWIADLEEAVANRDHPFYGQDHLVEDARRNVANARGRAGVGPLGPDDAARFLDDHEKALAAIDAEEKESLFFGRPLAAQRARERLIEEHEIRCRMVGVEPRQPETLEQKVERRLEQHWAIDQHIERWNASHENDIERPLRHLQYHTIRWSNGFPTSDEEQAECRAMLAQGKPLQGTKYEFCRILQAPADVLEDMRAEVRAEFGAERYEEMRQDALYCTKFDPKATLPLGWDGNRYTLRFLAARGAYLRRYDDAREIAKLPRRGAAK